MYEIRKIDNENGKLTHVWFNVKSYEEAVETIVKSCFGKHNSNIFERRNSYGMTHWYSNGPMGLWRDDNNKMKFEFDNEIGPSTEFVFEISLV